MRTLLKINGKWPARLTRNLLLGAVLCSVLPGLTLRAAQNLSVAWNPTAGAAGYYFYCGTNGTNYTSLFDVGTNSTITLTGLTEGRTNNFTVVGYNSARMLGTPAAQMSFIVPGCIRFNAATSAGAPANICFPVAVGHSYQVEASTNLQTWTNIWQTSMSTSNAWVYYQDPQAGSFTMRFYRLILN